MPVTARKKKPIVPLENKVLIEIELPLPPSINDLYATVNGRRVKSLAGRIYVKNVIAAIHQKYEEPPILPKQPLVIYIEWHKPTLFTYDIDGMVKALQDSIFSACSQLGNKNDAWVVESHIRKVMSDEFKAVVRLETL